MFLLNYEDVGFVELVNVFVSYIRRYVLTNEIKDRKGKMIEFSSPIFGDVFLLRIVIRQPCVPAYKVFVSYIRRYVLTHNAISLFMVTSYVFVSYIRRYVLTRIT